LLEKLLAKSAAASIEDSLHRLQRAAEAAYRKGKA
jgi:hypothetical protein